ncbi:unnamed protein product [Cuscuta epithymum]|uniref:Uncharacterized protein n=1 Tax=Cuscuta epithymum TaxID=186058 RepID=A0AAV0DTR2_9ASTE|nr:unnamed protein product [Cuscuta epithymum]CAH9143591.1 unnamed protein product [Cuscuta epithymum]
MALKQAMWKWRPLAAAAAACARSKMFSSSSLSILYGPESANYRLYAPDVLNFYMDIRRAKNGPDAHKYEDWNVPDEVQGYIDAGPNFEIMLYDLRKLPKLAAGDLLHRYDLVQKIDDEIDLGGIDPNAIPCYKERYHSGEAKQLKTLLNDIKRINRKNNKFPKKKKKKPISDYPSDSDDDPVEGPPYDYADECREFTQQYNKEQNKNLEFLGVTRVYLDESYKTRVHVFRAADPSAARVPILLEARCSYPDNRLLQVKPFKPVPVRGFGKTSGLSGLGKTSGLRGLGKPSGLRGLGKPSGHLLYECK